MAVKIEKSKTLTGMNITPLIDVVFLLLIFFLVAARFDQDERALDIQLPVATQAEVMLTEPQELIVNISADGEYRIAGKRMTFQEVKDHFEGDWREKTALSSVIIRGDERSPLGATVAVANLCVRLNLPFATIVKEKVSE